MTSGVSPRAGEHGLRWDEGLFFGSVTRVGDLSSRPLERERIPRDRWQNGDFVVGEVTKGSSDRLLELRGGRAVELTEGDLLVGALGRRHATLEATGRWEAVEEDGRMELLTGGGVLGRITSISLLVGTFPEVQYVGHLFVEGEKATMARFVQDEPASGSYATPTVLLVGTSMSAGKTTAARVLIRLLRAGGLSVLGAKLTGAGHYRDILSMADAGADPVMDFVDVGLPSTVVPEEEYRAALEILLNRMSGSGADVAVVEVGASPMEPYNGETAVAAIREHVRCMVLCASDPYAVTGILKAYPLAADLVTGPTSNTLAGVELVDRLSGLPALNLGDRSSWPAVARLLEEGLGLVRPLPFHLDEEDRI